MSPSFPSYNAIPTDRRIGKRWVELNSTHLIYAGFGKWDYTPKLTFLHLYPKMRRLENPTHAGPDVTQDGAPERVRLRASPLYETSWTIYHLLCCTYS